MIDIERLTLQSQKSKSCPCSPRDGPIAIRIADKGIIIFVSLELPDPRGSIMATDSQCLRLRQSHVLVHTSCARFGGYNFGFGGGSSRATTVSLNPQALCDPSQNGLFADCPQRHNPMAVRPAKPKTFPCGSTTSKSPSTRIEPLLPMVIFVAAISIL